MTATEIIYTDGACRANGSARAVGGFGVYVATSALFSAPVKINRKGQSMSFALNNEQIAFPVTNIRMEGLAIVSTLALYTDHLVASLGGPNSNGVVEEILNARNPFNTDGMKLVYGPQELNTGAVVGKSVTVEIVTDSLFWINVVQDWLSRWIHKGIALTKKNPDILLMLRYYTEYLKQHGVAVVFTHVKSHQRGARSAHADGNDIADHLATSAAHNDTTMFERKL